jgi:hypothetical protein
MERELVSLPDSMASLPVDVRGYPVPAFVAWIDGEPDFRVIKPGWLGECVRRNKCWLCGGHLGVRKWFVIGPMCAITRTTSEPPSHRLCAEFAVKNCPFLTKPMAKRNERDLPETRVTPAGRHIERNPGVVCVWETKHYGIFKDGNGRPLFDVGDPTGATFWREGRLARQEEVLESVTSGLHHLWAEAEGQGPPAQQALARQIEHFGRWLEAVLPSEHQRH